MDSVPLRLLNIMEKKKKNLKQVIYWKGDNTHTIKAEI